MWNWEHVSQLASFSRGMKLSLDYRVKFLLSCFTSLPAILYYFICSGLTSEGRMKSASFQPILWREDEQFPGRLKMYFQIFSSWRKNWAEVSHSLMKYYNRMRKRVLSLFSLLKESSLYWMQFWHWWDVAGKFRAHLLNPAFHQTKV